MHENPTVPTSPFIEIWIESSYIYIRDLPKATLFTCKDRFGHGTWQRALRRMVSAVTASGTAGGQAGKVESTEADQGETHKASKACPRRYMLDGTYRK